MSRRACEQAGFELLVMDARSIPSPDAERRELIALVDREAVLLGSGLYLDTDVLKPEESQGLLATMDRLAVPLFLASRERFSSERDASDFPGSKGHPSEGSFDIGPLDIGRRCGAARAGDKMKTLRLRSANIDARATRTVCCRLGQPDAD